MTILERSTLLNQLIGRAQALLDRHETRYLHLVTTSPQGADCRYARLTEQLAADPTEAASLNQLLTDMMTLLTKLEAKNDCK